MNTHQTSPRLLNFAISMQYAEKNDLCQVLELLHVSQDMQVQVKLFSILAVYLVSNGTHSDMIIKFNPLYDKICAVLARGLPQKTNVTLNFITALLYTDIVAATRRRALVAYAQNMLRTSGCLTAMANLFTACMIQQETWRALCQCLAETCNGMEKNQNYCSHLIPLCVRRCNQGSEYVFQLLQSLLHNNDHNMQLFYETGGHNVFSREFLKYDQCLQLLSTVISKPDYKIKLLEETNIFAELKDLKRLYGISSEVGQWATVILYAINNTTKAPVSETCKGLGKEPNVIDDVGDLKNVFQTKRAEKSPAKVSTKSNDDDSCKTHRANSFTSYMRKRDAYIKGDRSSIWDESQNECFTCNDTLSLKQKFVNDDVLKENVQRLKLGINLYGCDFKKISKTLWRNENYMTPSVLYNLYRKLILK
ncbi:unnamed protein product, partial [Iphiclides podalirius]